ncbi:MAG: DNA/RNA non-specific endonuclease [Muribaculaceae bacterium]|nr:DNA/RNA non-specific endonuclease [Muribaculaceae bacterium]
MKKPFIILILAAAVILIGIGIYGLARSRDPLPSPEDGEAQITGTAIPLETSGKHHSQTYDATPLLDVAMPAGIPSQVKDYEGFRLSFNKNNHTPNWVAWELLASEVGGDLPRAKSFAPDNEIEGCPTPADYKNSGYDRGHLCPAADQKWSQQAMNDCFFLTNICPQDNKLNTGDWNTLENKERVWAKRDSAILIVAGPIYSDSDRKTVGRTGVRVPGAFFKVFAAPFLDRPRGIAFIYPNMVSPGNMENYVTTIDEVEKITGYDFFAALPDDIENSIESKASFKEWNRR